MPTNDQEKFVVDSDASPDMIARIKAIQGEERNEGIVVNDVRPPENDQDDGINLDGGGSTDKSGGTSQDVDGAGDGGGAPSVETGDEGADQGDFDRSDFVEFLKQKGMSEDEYLDKLFYNKKFKVRMGGKDKELPYSEIKSVLARGTTFQKKYNEIENSDEYRFGVLMKAAQDGNPEAQKALKQKLMEFTGTENDDDMLDKLEDVEGEYDLDGEFDKRKNASAEDEHFSDVKDSVDYQKNLDIIQNDMKDFMPPKIWKAFWEAPEDRRAMYNLAATGRVKEIADFFQSELLKLPLEKQVEIESDPDLYGRAFITVTNRVLNANKTQQGEGSSDGGGSKPIQQVSNGTQGRVNRQSSSSVPDFMSMSREEFLAWQKKNGLS